MVLIRKTLGARHHKISVCSDNSRSSTPQQMEHSDCNWQLAVGHGVQISLLRSGRQPPGLPLHRASSNYFNNGQYLPGLVSTGSICQIIVSTMDRPEMSLIQVIQRISSCSFKHCDKCLLKTTGLTIPSPCVAPRLPRNSNSTSRASFHCLINGMS